ncbi:MAG: pentapeptide repeat-containing protein, partial [Rhodospirillales bacterium]|nr:pentapeptide repeat-containing protein [Rhodospirillales bacterium]
MTIKWRDNWDVGAPAIDQDHRKLLSIITEFSAVSAGKEDRLEGILEKLFRYSKEHFAREERIQRNIGMPEHDSHVAMHRNLSLHLTHLFGRLVAEGDPARKRAMVPDIGEFLKDWLVGHVLGADMKMRPYLARSGSRGVGASPNSKSDIPQQPARKRPPSGERPKISEGSSIPDERRQSDDGGSIEVAGDSQKPAPRRDYDLIDPEEKPQKTSRPDRQKMLESVLVEHERWLSSRRAEGKKAILGGLDIVGCVIAGRDLTDADARASDLSDANLDGATMMHADLRLATLSGISAQGCDFSMARMRHANLTLAKMNGAILRGCDLAGANLQRAVFDGADLTGALFLDTDISGADLSKAEGVRADQMARVVG